MANACILLADGFEEIEAVTVIDVLRRASVDVTLVGVHGDWVCGSHAIQIKTDMSLSEAQRREWNAAVLPGGLPGATTLRDDSNVQNFIRQQRDRDGVLLCAICAAPIALSAAGVLKDCRVTCYPGFEDQLDEATLCDDAVVVDGRVVTSRGAGTAMEFALTVAEQLAGAATAAALRKKMLVS
jgi:protein deglycase